MAHEHYCSSDLIDLDYVNGFVAERCCPSFPSHTFADSTVCYAFDYFDRNICCRSLVEENFQFEVRNTHILD